ncbi:helix-turn-helix domain-containing protein [Streptomyces bacillaris]|uniref:helix-turn-helix domain-containing protein n=1 Tax=Streptomyces bacillaris TaxID=68179 RepID=UPI00362A189A
MTPHNKRRPRGAPFHHAPEAVTYAREKAGLTKRALAGMCDISEQLVGDIEAGRRNATPATLQKLAAALNCPVVVLEAKRVTAPRQRSEEQTLNSAAGGTCSDTPPAGLPAA